MYCFRYGSPTIDDIEAFSIAYREQLDKAVAEGRMPADVAFEVPIVYHPFSLM
jgi:hypothetical protein